METYTNSVFCFLYYQLQMLITSCYLIELKLSCRSPVNFTQQRISPGASSRPYRPYRSEGPPTVFGFPLWLPFTHLNFFPHRGCSGYIFLLVPLAYSYSPRNYSGPFTLHKHTSHSLSQMEDCGTEMCSDLFKRPHLKTSIPGEPPR